MFIFEQGARGLRRMRCAMKSDVRVKIHLTGFATILTTLLAGMTFAMVNSTYAASEEKNAVPVKAAVVLPVVHSKVLVFPIVIKEAVVKIKAVKADSKVSANRNALIKNQIFVRNPFFLEEAFEEFD